MAVRAAPGHLVLSTLHTNRRGDLARWSTWASRTTSSRRRSSAYGRLVRGLPGVQGPTPDAAIREKHALGRTIGSSAGGCRACLNTGYRGRGGQRTAPRRRAIQRAVLDGKSSGEIHRVAVERGMITSGARSTRSHAANDLQRSSEHPADGARGTCPHAAPPAPDPPGVPPRRTPQRPGSTPGPTPARDRAGRNVPRDASGQGVRRRSRRGQRRRRSCATKGLVVLDIRAAGRRRAACRGRARRFATQGCSGVAAPRGGGRECARSRC